MSTGSSKDFDFGMNQTEASTSPLPADSARKEKHTPLPSEIARNTGATPLPSDTIGMQEKRPRKNKAKQENTEAPLSALYMDERQQRRRKNCIIGAVTVFVSILSLFINTGYGGFFNPGDVFASYGMWFSQTFAGITGAATLSGNELIAQCPDYYFIINRVAITLMTIICGAVLAVAGTLYQSAFRNPIASPSVLGISSAIQLGNVILVLVLNTAAATALGWRYLICYLCVVVVMALLFGFARLMTGKDRPLNVVNLLLIATIINQIIGVVVTYVTTFVFSLEQWEIYNNISEALTVSLDPLSWVVLLVTCAVGIIPIALLRFRLNGLNFGDTDMKMLGIDAPKLRLIALLCGTVLLMATQVQMGTIAMLALVVPHVSRMIFGAEFRKQFWGNVMLGAALLVLCRDIVSFIPVLGAILPVSVVLNFVILPVFVWMLATQQRGWEQ